MTDFVSEVDAFIFQEKGVHVSDLDFMEMPKEKERYNLSKVIGNANLTEGRFKTIAEAEAIIGKFLSISLQ
jgi:CYTH domain-containing protein